MSVEATIPTVEPTPNHCTLSCGQRAGTRPDDDTQRPWCADGTGCDARPSYLVTVGGVTYAACSHHKSNAERDAADEAGVRLDRSAEPTVTADEVAGTDYDVSDTLDALRDDGSAECDECGHAVHPTADGGTRCPKCDEQRSPRGGVPMTDGGTDMSDAYADLHPFVRESVDADHTESVTVHGVRVNGYDGAADDPEAIVRDARVLAATIGKHSSDMIHRVNPWIVGHSIWIAKGSPGEPVGMEIPAEWPVDDVFMAKSGNVSVRVDHGPEVDR